MARWQPHAKQRLEAAALELFSSRGYDATTVADIAGLGGVTPRTFFRHFTDKREALFGGADAIRDRIDLGLGRAPADLPPLGVCVWAMKECEELFGQRDHDDLRRREAVIEGSEELREREALKLRSIAAAFTSELRRRAVPHLEAAMIADAAVVVFVHASRLWMLAPDASFAATVDRAVAAMGDAFG